MSKHFFSYSVTRLEHIASLAMQGLQASNDENSVKVYNTTEIAQIAVEQALELIKAIDAHENPSLKYCKECSRPNEVGNHLDCEVVT